MTPKMLAFGSCPPSTAVLIVPEHPLTVVMGWPWLSWPRTKRTSTLEQSIVPSSGSVTVTSNGISSPKLNSCPSPGSFSSTFGAVLPTVTWALAEAVRPVGSLAVTVAV